MRNENIKICLISSSGGHNEQLKQLKPLSEKYNVFWVTEKTEFETEGDYHLIQTGLKDKYYIWKMIKNTVESMRIWLIEKPDLVITTGAMVALPISIIAKIFQKKVIFIETFARVTDGTKTGKLMYKFADLFIIQWESLYDIYPEAKYGGSIY